MKILYAAGNRSSSGDQFRRVKEHISNHEIKLAAFASAIQFVPIIDFVLDYFYSFWHERFSYDRVARGGSLRKELEVYIASVAEFAPDLIIADQEPLTAAVGKFLKIPIWYCSPVHLVDGCSIRSNSFFYRDQFDFFRSELRVWPKVDRTFIYSPFSRLKVVSIKKDFEWIEPYSDIKRSSNKDLNFAFFSQRENEIYSIFNASKFEGPFFSHAKKSSSKIFGYSIIDSEYNSLLAQSNNVFCAGETSVISDALNNNSNIVVCPNLDDVETVINATILKEANVGRELGQIELMDDVAVDEINRSLNEKFSYKIRNNNLNVLHLHDLINKG